MIQMKKIKYDVDSSVRFADGSIFEQCSNRLVHIVSRGSYVIVRGVVNPLKGV
jgi:hypothetical protein